VAYYSERRQPAATPLAAGRAHLLKLDQQQDVADALDGIADEQ